MSGLNRRNSRTRSTSSYQQIPEDQLFQTEEVHEMTESNKKLEDKSSKVDWLSTVNIGTELLENKGSVARDHMANERTFLSWIRTSMGLATCGVGITQLFKLNTDNGNSDEFLSKVGRPIGASFILIAIICVIMGLFRFFNTQSLLKQEKYPAARLSVSVLVFLVLALCIVTLVTVLYVNSSNH